jgi:hypothetical protein
VFQEVHFELVLEGAAAEEAAALGRQLRLGAYD